MNQKQTARATTERQQASVLIASHSGRMRDSLRLLLAAAPGVEVVGCADDSASALIKVANLYPDLLLLDANLPGADMTTVLEKVRSNGSRPRCLVLVDTQRQQRDALAAGADAVLIKGYPTTKLFETIRDLMVKEQSLRNDSR